MNQKIIFLSLISIFLIQNTLLSSNDPILVTTKKEDKLVKVSMNLEIEGAVKLYSVLKKDIVEEDGVSAKEVTLTNWVLHPNKDFYIGAGAEAEMITPLNFKRLAKKYFTAIPELTKKIGKRGFRYKNLPSMILFYNKMMTNQGGLTKEDVMAHQ